MGFGIDRRARSRKGKGLFRRAPDPKGVGQRLAFLLLRMKGKSGDPGELSVFQGVSYYWHFVDVVWVGLYACLFLLK